MRQEATETAVSRFVQLPTVQCSVVIDRRARPVAWRISPPCSTSRSMRSKPALANRGRSPAQGHQR